MWVRWHCILSVLHQIKIRYINPWFWRCSLFCYEPVQHNYFFAVLLYSIVYSARWVSIYLNLWGIPNYFFRIEGGTDGYASIPYYFAYISAEFNLHTHLLRVGFSIKIYLSWFLYGISMNMVTRFIHIDF